MAKAIVGEMRGFRAKMSDAEKKLVLALITNRGQGRWPRQSFMPEGETSTLAGLQRARGVAMLGP
jgi:hypothetical protein